MGDTGSRTHSAAFLSECCTSAQFTPTPHSIHTPTHYHPTARNNQTLELMRPPGADSHSHRDHRLPTQSHAAVNHHGLHVSSVPILTPPSTWDHSGRRVIFFLLHGDRHGHHVLRLLSWSTCSGQTRAHAHRQTPHFHTSSRVENRSTGSPNCA